MAAERYDGRQPVKLVVGMEISIKDLAETTIDVSGLIFASSGTQENRKVNRAGYWTSAGPKSPLGSEHTRIYGMA